MDFYNTIKRSDYVNKGVFETEFERPNLKLGSVQTLAYQDENRKWVLNNLPTHEVEEFYNHHYITIRYDSAITAAWSDGPHPEKDITNAICINEQGGYQFRLYPGGEENPNLYDMDGIPLYKWDGENVIRRTEEEIEEERLSILNSSSVKIAEIKQQLINLDNQSIRPLRAILAGTPTDEDKQKLGELEAEAQKLRDNLNCMQETADEENEE